MPDSAETERRLIPDWLIKWGGMAWRLLAIGTVVYFGFQILKTVSVVIIAVILALFLASVLWKPVRWLMDRANWPPALASLTVVVGALLVLAGVVAVVVPQVASNFDSLSQDLAAAWEDFRDWLVTGPLGLSEQQIDDFIDQAFEQARNIQGSSVLGGASAVVEIISGFFLALIATFFVLKDGRAMMDKLLERLPDKRAQDVEAGVRAGWVTLSHYMGGIALVGLFDAVVIAIGMLVVGVPLVLPIAILVFFGAFFPLIGAFVSGLFAVAVAFVNGGLVDGLIILAIVTAVQQFEGDVVMPLVFGRTLRLHPLVIMLGVAAGGIAFGLFGAFLAVPVIAVIVAVREAVDDSSEPSLLSLTRGR